MCFYMWTPVFGIHFKAVYQKKKKKKGKIKTPNPQSKAKSRKML